MIPEQQVMKTLEDARSLLRKAREMKDERLIDVAQRTMDLALDMYNRYKEARKA